MKNLKLASFSIMFLFTILFFTSCDKEDEISLEQQRIETLAAGAWSLTSSTRNGVELDFGGTLVFLNTYGYCILSSGDCGGSNSYVWELDNTGEIIHGSSKFTYRMHDEGTKMTKNTIETTTNGVTSLCTSNCEDVFTVLEWSDTKHVLETVDGNGDVSTLTMEMF
jgi:hypothetical protein